MRSALFKVGIVTTESLADQHHTHRSCAAPPVSAAAGCTALLGPVAGPCCHIKQRGPPGAVLFSGAPASSSKAAHSNAAPPQPALGTCGQARPAPRSDLPARKIASLPRCRGDAASSSSADSDHRRPLPRTVADSTACRAAIPRDAGPVVHRMPAWRCCAFSASTPPGKTALMRIAAGRIARQRSGECVVAHGDPHSHYLPARLARIASI
jgi:hypothetical protein